MKAERRHELQENILAGWLAQQIALVKPYWQVIATAAIVVVLGFAAYFILSYKWSTERAVGWVDYFDAVGNRDIDKLEEVAEAHPEATAGLWALRAAGDERLLDGTNRLYSNPAGARLELHKAIENYESVLDRTEEPMLVRRALFGLARAHESIGELDEAKERFGELAEKFPDTPVGKVAKERIEYLSRPSTKEFLAWLGKQKFDTPPPTPPPGGGEAGSPLGAGGGMPPFGAGGGFPPPGGPGSSSPQEEALMNLPDLTDPLGIGGTAAGQPATETTEPQTATPDGSEPDAGETSDDPAAESTEAGSETAPATENTEAGSETPPATESTEAGSETPAPENGTTESGPAATGEPAEEPAGNTAEAESSSEAAPAKADDVTEPAESGSDKE